MSADLGKSERARPRPAQLPLQGVRVLAVEQFGAGPYGTMFLAHLGADVIKIENPATRGDPSRHTGPYFLGESDSQYFQGWNTNKRSVALDIKTPEGRAAFEELVRDADVVLNNLRGDQAGRLGLEYEDLSPLNPAIVCVHISAYGRDNSRAAWPGYDYLMQAETGLMHLTGEPDTPPARVGAPSIVDHMTGMTSMIGLLSALLRARETGQGCDVDTSLFDVALHQLGYAATWLLNEGHVASRQERSGHYSLAPVQTFPTADGWIFVMCMTQKFWEALVDVLGRHDLAAAPEFGTAAARNENRGKLTQALDAEFRRQPTSHWLSRLQGVLPVAPVRSLSDALESDFFRESGMLAEVEHPAKPSLRLLANPLKFDGLRPALRACSPLGADTDDVIPAGELEGPAA
ncbi:CaiB/BaiF CoA-transferase family protein [Variovorax sp. Sphag1AA]|uniref:CaiB/BaiF CoA transferase family protein n=1 Tax=Variovorax sp. Sphag1AA TaxID=2587027 RepID=UPI00161573B5|nr:CoA transferase [Variovorax sp. Sphag1AA]MBB3180923.1 crotonobetainyl-CoA:carnitine CoA-transferase CaiB-like acyl-CoA transferase [Variovorax sp. Sphag1AA]